MPATTEHLTQTIEDRYREAAKRLYHDEGVLEIDENATVSRPEDGEGAYVAAWVWVNRDEISNRT